jgi:hypothetical protein
MLLTISNNNNDDIVETMLESTNVVCLLGQEEPHLKSVFDTMKIPAQPYIEVVKLCTPPVDGKVHSVE